MASVAWATKVCAPSASAVYVFGLEHDAGGAPSSWQVKVTGVLSALKAKLASVSLVVAFGPLAIVTIGARVSIVQEVAWGAPTFPTASVARTANEWLPAASPE